MTDDRRLIVHIGYQPTEDGQFRSVVGWELDGNKRPYIFSEMLYPTESDALAAAEYMVGVAMKIAETMGYGFGVLHDITSN